jgi:hypothetical protein
MKSTLITTMSSRNRLEYGKGEHTVKHAFVSVPDMYKMMVTKIISKIFDLQYGPLDYGVQCGVTDLADLELVGREIRGMIALLECCADAPTMRDELLERLTEAHAAKNYHHTRELERVRELERLTQAHASLPLCK